MSRASRRAPLRCVLLAACAAALQLPAASVSAQPAEGEGAFELSHLREAGGMDADAAAERAVAVHPELEKARASAVVAEAGARRALVAAFPQLELSASYTRLSDVPQPSLTGDGGGDLDALIAEVDDPEARALFQGLTGFEFPIQLDNWSLDATLSYPVSALLLEVLPARRAAERGADAERARLEAERAEIALRAREAFYAYARARAASLVAEASVAQAEAQHRSVSAQVEAGAAARVEALRMQARVAAARGAAARAQGGVAVAERALRVLLELPADTKLAIGQELSTTPPAPQGDRRALEQRALEQRAEMRAVRAALGAQEQAASAAAGARWPELLLHGGIKYANPNPRVFPQTDEWHASWEVGAILRWSPTETADAAMRTDEARAEAARSRADVAALENALRMEVARAWEDLAAARTALEVAEVGVEAADETYRVRFEQLEAGATTADTVIDAEAELTSARLRVVDALIDVHVASARLRRAAAL